MKKRPPFHRRGAALLLTLWCIAVVAVSVVFTARMVDDDVVGESMRSRRFEARELALTGVAYGANPTIKRDSRLLHQTMENENQLAVRITSESARLNINLLLQKEDKETLGRLFKLWGVPDNEARIAIDSLADWVDENDLRRLNGAEEESLRGAAVYSLPQNREFQSVSEMRRVRGMDAVARCKPDWAEFFTVFGTGGLDMRDASADVLYAAGGLSLAQAGTLVDFRKGRDGVPGTPDDKVVETLEQAILLLDLSEAQVEFLRPIFLVGAEPMRIESTAEVGQVRYRISSVMNRGQDKFACLSWEEK